MTELEVTDPVVEQPVVVDDEGNADTPKVAEQQEGEMNYQQLYLAEKEKAEKWKSRFKKTMSQKQEPTGDDDVDAIVAQKLLEKEIVTKVNVVRSQLPDELKAKFDVEYEELTNGRVLSPDMVDKYIKSVLTIIAPEDDKEIERVKATAVGWGVPTKTGAAKQTKEQSLKEQSNAFLKEQGIL